MHLGLQRAIRKLKRDFPLRLPVQVRTYEVLICKDRGRLFGTAEQVGNVFKICIQRHVDVSIQIDTLWHEWAHCLIWPRCRVRHTKLFFITYGEIYSHYQD